MWLLNNIVHLPFFLLFPLWSSSPFLFLFLYSFLLSYSLFMSSSMRNEFSALATIQLLWNLAISPWENLHLSWFLQTPFPFISNLQTVWKIQARHIIPGIETVFLATRSHACCIASNCPGSTGTVPNFYYSRLSRTDLLPSFSLSRKLLRQFLLI